MKLRVSLAAAALTLGPTFAHAQSAGNGFADAAFNQGRTLFEQGKIPEACAKFQSSLDLEFQRTTLQALAVCREKEGKWASAWQGFLELARKSSQAGDEDKARLARKKAADLEPKLLYVVLSMDAPPSGLEIKLDNSKLDASLLGTRLPVDPGEHVLSATATGKKPWNQKITSSATQTEQAVKIPALDDAPAAPSTSIPPPPAGHTGSFWTTQRTVGAIVGGAGILALGGAAVFQIVALSEASERDKLDTKVEGEPAFGSAGCAIGQPNGSSCPNRVSQETRDSAAKTNQTVAIVLASAGGAMVVTGIVLIATGGHKSASATWKPKSPLLADFSLTPTVSPRSIGLVGTF